MDQNQISTPNTLAQPGQKQQYKSFWPLVIIALVAVIAGGLIYWFQFNLSVEEDLNSIVFSVQRRSAPHPQTQTQTNQNPNGPDYQPGKKLP